MNRAILAAVASAIAASAASAAVLEVPTQESAIVKVVVESASGTIMSVDRDAKTFVLASGEEEVTVSFNETTKFLLDGKEADAARVLKIGSKVKVAHEGGVAQKVEAHTQE